MAKNSNNMVNKSLGIGMSYAYNIPLFCIIAFIFSVLVYQLLNSYRDRDDVVRHKINTEIKKKLYY